MSSVIDATRRLDISTEAWKVSRLARDYTPPSPEHPDGSGRLYLPKHQRLWSWKNKRGLKKQQALIDSILHNYPVPTIILNAVDDGVRERWEVYDGRHRVETIWRFVNDKFGIMVDGAEVKYSALADADQSRFNDRTLPVVITADASPTQLGEVFIRLNSGKALSQADYCHACRDTPLIEATLDIIESNVDRFRPLFGVDISSRELVPNWVGIALGLSTGVAGNMTTSFERIQVHLDDTVNIDKVTAGMDALFDLYTRAAAATASSPSELKRYVKIGFINAFFLADLMQSDYETAVTNWVRVISHIRTTRNSSLVITSGAQNLTTDKINAVHRKVHAWLSTGSMPLNDTGSEDSEDE